MRRKAVRALDIHTKDSIQHLKDDDDEMLRGWTMLELSVPPEMSDVRVMCLLTKHTHSVYIHSRVYRSLSLCLKADITLGTSGFRALLSFDVVQSWQN